LLLFSSNVAPPPPLRHPTLQRINPTAVFAVFECKGKNNLGNMQKRNEKIADIRKSPYLCSVKAYAMKQVYDDLKEAGLIK
jgi:hypothetical protein